MKSCVNRSPKVKIEKEGNIKLSKAYRSFAAEKIVRRKNKDVRD